MANSAAAISCGELKGCAVWNDFDVRLRVVSKR